MFLHFSLSSSKSLKTSSINSFNPDLCFYDRPSCNLWAFLEQCNKMYGSLSLLDHACISPNFLFCNSLHIFSCPWFYLFFYFWEKITYIFILYVFLMDCCHPQKMLSSSLFPQFICGCNWKKTCAEWSFGGIYLKLITTLLFHIFFSLE